MTQTLTQHHWHRKALGKPSLDGCSINTEPHGPVLQNHAATCVCKPDVSARVAQLLALRGPLTVCRRVVAAIVNPVNAVLRAWPWSHVGQKRSETARPTPSLTYGNAATFVVDEVGRGWALTPSPQSNPCAPLGGVRSVVRGSSLGGLLATKAPATALPPSYQARRQHKGALSAHALALPMASVSSAVMFLVRGQNSETAECHSGQIVGSSGHDVGIILPRICLK